MAYDLGITDEQDGLATASYDLSSTDGQKGVGQESRRLANVPIPRQGFKVPQASQVVNSGLREFARLYDELVDAMAKRATQRTLDGIRGQIVRLEADMRTAGRLLGMLSPWQPRVNTYADGAASDATAPLTLANPASKYRFPWIEDALDFLTGKEVVTAEQFATMADEDRRHVFHAPGIDTTKQLKSLQTSFAKSLELGEDLRGFRKRIEAETALTRSQTETLYRTETKRGYVAGFDKAMKSPVVNVEFPAVLFSATPDQRVRDEHWDLDGTVCLRSDPAYKLMLKAASDYNCILPGNELLGSVLCGVKSFYEGQAVEIVCDAGRKLRVTKNHPVLTTNGWVAAGMIDDSDELVLDMGPIPERADWLAVDSFCGWATQVNKVPTRVEDVFGTLSVACERRIEHRRADPADFHGEAEQFTGDVDVVWSDAELLRHIQAERTKEIRNLILEPSLVGSVDWSDLPSASLRGHARPLQSLGFAGVAVPDSTVCEASVDGCSADAELITDGLDRLPVVEHGRDSVVAHVVAARDGGHTLTVEPSPDRGCADSEVSGKLWSTHPTRSVQVSRVAGVRHFNYSGEVYDFQTPSGIIVLNGVLITNCRCAMIPLSMEEAESRGIKTLSDLPREVRAKYG